MWNELTFLWTELTILCNDLTIDWNDVTMERNDRIPSCTEQTTDEQIKIFVTENTESNTFCMEEYSENTPLSSEIHCYIKNIKGLHLNRYRSNFNSVRFLLKGQLQN